MYKKMSEYEATKGILNILSFEMDGLTIDTGYGERDCVISADVDTELMKVINCSVWLIDQDGGDHHWSDDCEEFDDAILEEASIIIKRSNGDY